MAGAETDRVYGVRVGEDATDLTMWNGGEVGVEFGSRREGERNVVVWRDGGQENSC